MSSDNLILEGEDAIKHLSQLELALNALSTQYRGNLNSEQVSQYAKRIAETMNIFRYERSPERKIGTKEYTAQKTEGESCKYSQRFEIDPTTAGFPNSTFLRDLCARKELAQEYINRIPSPEAIAQSARQKILCGQMPSEEQELLAELKFYNNLKNSRIASIREHDIINVKECEEGISVNLGICGMNLALNLYTYFALDFVYKKEKKEFDANKEKFITSFFENCFGTSAFMTFLTLNALENFKPKKVDRYLIGPFYNKYTENTDALNDIIDETDAFALTFLHEYVTSDKTVITAPEKKKGIKKLWSKITRKNDEEKSMSTEICSKPIAEEFVLVPHAVVRRFEEIFSKKQLIQVIPI